MNYEFTKDCEIMNCEFLEGEIVDAKAVQFYPTVMKQTEEAVTHTVAKTGDTLVKTEVVKAKNSKKADPKEGEAKKEEKKNSEKADPKEGEAKKEEKKNSKKADPKEGEAKKEEKKNSKKADPKEGEAKAE